MNNKLLLLLTFAFVNSVTSYEYPINIACNTDFSLYVDEKFVGQGSIMNNTYEFNVEIIKENPKIIAIEAQNNNGSGAFIGNFGNKPSKYQDWKCMDYTNQKVPSNWYMYDFDDSKWDFSIPYGLNTNNNEWQINNEPRPNINNDA